MHRRLFVLVNHFHTRHVREWLPSQSIVANIAQGGIQDSISVDPISKILSALRSAQRRHHPSCVPLADSVSAKINPRAMRMTTVERDSNSGATAKTARGNIRLNLRSNNRRCAILHSWRANDKEIISFPRSLQPPSANLVIIEAQLLIYRGRVGATRSTANCPDETLIVRFAQKTTVPLASCVSRASRTIVLN